MVYVWWWWWWWWWWRWWRWWGCNALSMHWVGYDQVYKLGSITRAINVNQFSNYEELRGALARMFNLECQLDQDLGWKLVFLDNENDLLLVGDDPWEYVITLLFWKNSSSFSFSSWLHHPSLRQHDCWRFFQRTDFKLDRFIYGGGFLFLQKALERLTLCFFFFPLGVFCRVFVSTVRAIRILSPAEVSFCMSLKEEESGVCL